MLESCRGGLVDWWQQIEEVTVVLARERAEAMSAIEEIASGIDRLLGMADATALAALGPESLIDVLRAFEAQRNRLSAVDHGLVEAVQMEQLWERTTARDPAGALAQILHLSGGEANARVKAAEWFGPRISMSGQELPPALPAAAKAQRAGRVTPAQSAVIGHCIAELGTDPQLSGDEIASAEQTLVDHAQAFGPRALQRVAAKIVDVLIPDGSVPRDALTQARRGIVLGPQRRDGTASINGTLTPELRAQLWAVLSPLSAPHRAEDGAVDTRSAPQRLHDGLSAACALLLRSDSLPSSGGVPATVIVTATLEQITAATEIAQSERVTDRAGPTFITADGTRLSLAQMLRIAAEAEVIPAFMDTAGAVVAYGRSRRVASAGQRRALLARDGGCSFPDCGVPAQWCQAHHVVPWITGGTTDLSNLTLLCRYHHRTFEQRTWECRMIDRTPYWIPPPWVDPEQRPLQNRRVCHGKALDRRRTAPDRAASLACELARGLDEAVASWIETALGEAARNLGTEAAPQWVSEQTGSPPFMIELEYCH